MHKFLRSIGFAEIKKADLKIILDEAIERPKRVKVTRDYEGNELVEFAKQYGEGFGIIVRGSIDEEENFRMDYYVPYVEGEELSTGAQIDIEKHAEKESYAGICDDIRLGVSLIFYVQNVADFLSEYRHNIYTRDIHGASLSGLSTDGRILLPVQQNGVKNQALKADKRNELIVQARAGNEEAMESLALQDLEIYNSISNRLKKEDVLSIVDTTFMPYGIESDHYGVIGTILEVKQAENNITEEKVYILKIKCNDIVFTISINTLDLIGEPQVGRRFKGSIWMQGNLNL